MSKGLPYFKFHPEEWLQGNITLEDFHTQGVFINVCAFYWSRGGDITVEQLNKRFRHSSQQIDTLIDAGMIARVDDETERSGWWSSLTDFMRDRPADQIRDAQLTSMDFSRTNLRASMLECLRARSPSHCR